MYIYARNLDLKAVLINCFLKIEYICFLKITKIIEPPKCLRSIRGTLQTSFFQLVNFQVIVCKQMPKLQLRTKIDFFKILFNEKLNFQKSYVQLQDKKTIKM